MRLGVILANATPVMAKLALVSCSEISVHILNVHLLIECSVQILVVPFADVDECLEGSHNCDVNAVCANQLGNFICDCKEGFTGDGLTCTGEQGSFQNTFPFNF